MSAASEESELTRSQIDKLGERLKADETLTDADLALLGRYQTALRPLYQETRLLMAGIFSHALPDVPFSPSMREKQLSSIIAKLQRPPSSRFSSMQDVVGFRVVLPRVHHQNTLLSFVPTDDEWKIIDRRESPSNGYRAVHIVRRARLGAVEIQIRTGLQHRWADLSEALERVVPGTKYGAGPADLQGLLMRLSAEVAEFESLDAHRSIATSQQKRLDAVHRAWNKTFDILQSVMTEENMP